MQPLTRNDLSTPGATLGAGVTGGFIAGLIIGGVGGRLAMLLLRLTSDPVLRGVTTDDGFTIGRFSSETIFLLGVTSGLGMAGGLVYLAIRGWLPERGRVLAMTVWFALVGGSSLVSPDGLDFSALSPLPLAVALFVAIPAAFGAVMPWLTERLLREDSVLRRRPWGWALGLLPLALANVVGVVVLLGAFGAWSLGRAAPRAVAVWRSGAVRWIGRAFLVTTALWSGVQLARDTIDIVG